MNFIALLVGLGIERLLAAHLAMREPRWLLGYVRFALRCVARSRGVGLAVALAAALAPGIAIALLLGLSPFPGNPVLRVLVSAAVLFFALGPKDLAQEVTEYRGALARGDRGAADEIAAAILEHDAGQRHGPGFESVAEAVFVQANNRLFGVMFWFAVAGPLGALAFRLTDLMRREAIGRAERADAPPRARAVSELAQRLHGVIAFVPARLLAFSYGIAGSFEESFTGWRGYLAGESDHFFDANDRLLVHAGRGALGARWSGASDEGARAGAAEGLTRAAFYVWLAVFALVTVPSWIA